MLFPSCCLAYSLFFPGNSGFEPRQPAHDLMANFPYTPLEDRYNRYPHSLRNMGEQTLHCGIKWMQFCLFDTKKPPKLSCLSDELCASIVRSHRETSQYRVEELQALRWKLFSREEIQSYQSKVNQPDSCSLVPTLIHLLSYLISFIQAVS